MPSAQLNYKFCSQCFYSDENQPLVIPATCRQDRYLRDDWYLPKKKPLGGQRPLATPIAACPPGGTVAGARRRALEPQAYRLLGLDGRQWPWPQRPVFARASAVSLGGRPEDGGKREGSRLPPSTSRLQGITLTLSVPQVRGVLREATGADGLRELLVEQVDDLQRTVAAVLGNPALDVQRLAVSSLRMLSVFCAFAPRGTIRGINEVAEGQGMSHSTVYRYVQALVAVELLEQTKGRKYRIPPHDNVSRTET
jgi:hypothetical protein